MVSLHNWRQRGMRAICLFSSGTSLVVWACTRLNKPWKAVVRPRSGRERAAATTDAKHNKSLGWTQCLPRRTHEAAMNLNAHVEELAELDLRVDEALCRVRTHSEACARASSSRQIEAAQETRRMMWVPLLPTFPGRMHVFCVWGQCDIARNPNDPHCSDFEKRCT